MAYTAIPNSDGLPWPFNRNVEFSNSSNALMDAAGERVAFIGRLHIHGRPAGTKTIDSSGSSSIGFIPGAITFANAGTSLTIGIQGVGTGGPIAQPDGTFGAQATLTGGGGGLTANTWKELAPTSGSSTLAHGDLVAVVFDMTARGGADSVVILTGANTATPQYGFPVANLRTGGAWGTTVIGMPMVSLTFSDGTLGTLYGVGWAGLIATRTWSDATNPDERGNIFQVPFACKVAGIWLSMRTVDATSDYTVSLFSDPEGSPTMLDSVAVDAAQHGATATGTMAWHPFDAEVELAANTDYCVAVRATGAGNIRYTELSVPSGVAGQRALWYPGGTSLRSVTRDGGSGAFGSSNTLLYNPIGVGISAVETGGGGGGPLIGGRLVA